MEKVIFYFSAVLLGMVLCGILDFAMRFLKKRKATAVVEQSVTISEGHIQDCILPNNRGKSIDVIVHNLKSHNIDPDFSVDFS